MADDQEQTTPEWAQAPEFDLEAPPETPTDQEYKDQARKEYLEWIEQNPEYQQILDQTRDDYKPKSWISNPVKLPRFSTEEFEAMKEKYQAKYGSKIVIPKFEDTIQWNAPPSITAEEYAAHKYAQKHGLASPLDDEQLAYLAAKKQMFLNMLSSPDSAFVHDAAALITMLDAAQQALISLVVLGKLTLKAAPNLLKGLEGPLGWALLGADILNVADIYSQVNISSNRKKRALEKSADRNPFSKRAYASRAANLSRAWPTIGEFIQLAHTADHMFGVGLSLGAICGFQTQAFLEGAKQGVQAIQNIRDTILYPSKAEEIWADALTTLGALWASRDVIDVAGPATLIEIGNLALSAITPKFLQKLEVDGYREFQKYDASVPSPKYDWTKDYFNEFGFDPYAQLDWPMMNKPTASIDDINDVYPGITTDNLQNYLLKNHDTAEGLISCHGVTDYVEQAVDTFSDIPDTFNAQDAFTTAMKNLARANLAWAFDTPKDKLERLAEWIGKHEIDTGDAPSAKEIKIQGMQIGIKFPFTPQTGLGPSVKELFPKWSAIQDQLGKYNIDP